MNTNKTLIISINIAALMVLIDLAAINIALPSIRQHFDISVTQVSLILMTSMLTATGSSLVIGKLIERINPAKILLIAFFVFGLSTSLIALCTNFYYIIPIRAIQGLSEAALYVTGPALIKKHISKISQQKEYGIWMMSCGLGISLGPLLGGLILKYLSWNYVFLINLPLSIIGVYFSLKMMKEIPFEKRESLNFDYRGSIFSFLFLSFLIIFFNLLSILPIYHFITIIAGSLSLFSFWAFIKTEKSVKLPIIDLKLFRIHNFRLANVGFYLFFFVNVGSRFLRPFYFEEARGFSSSLSGLLMMVSPTIMLVVSFFISKFEKVFSTKQLVISGSILLSISMLMFSFWDENSSLLFIDFSMVILGLAMGIYYPTSTQLGMKSLPNNYHGTGSAVISISKSFGKLMGVLIFGLLFQFFFNLLNENSSFEIVNKNIAVHYVFLSAFGVSIINTFLSFFIKRGD